MKKLLTRGIVAEIGILMREDKKMLEERLDDWNVLVRKKLSRFIDLDNYTEIKTTEGFVYRLKKELLEDYIHDFLQTMESVRPCISDFTQMYFDKEAPNSKEQFTKETYPFTFHVEDDTTDYLDLKESLGKMSLTGEKEKKTMTYRMEDGCWLFYDSALDDKYMVSISYIDVLEADSEVIVEEDEEFLNFVNSMNTCNIENPLARSLVYHLIDVVHIQIQIS